MTSNRLKQLIAEHIDFPKKGIIFKDILPILEHPDIFEEQINNISLLFSRELLMDLKLSLFCFFNLVSCIISAHYK